MGLSGGVGGEALRRLTALYELPGPRRIIPFEGLRGLAVLLVFFVHYNAAFGKLLQPGPATATVGRVLWSIGHSGVDLFFVLSGYLIYGSLIAKRVRFPRYLKRRIERIYPTFLAVLGLYLLLSVLFPERSKLPTAASGPIIYLLQNVLLLPGIFAIPPIITVAWSLSYEFFFYLVVPVVVGALGLRDRRPQVRIALFVLFAVIYAVAHALGAPHERALLFVAGVLVYDATQLAWEREQVARVARGVVGLAVVAVPLLYALESRPEWLAPLAPPGSAAASILRTAWLFALFFGLVFVCLMPRTRAGSLFSWTPLRWLGNMSYSYYLLHGLTINASAIVFGALTGGSYGNSGSLLYWLMLPVSFAGTLVTSTILFAAVERPLSLRDTRAPREVAAAGIAAA